MPDWVRWKPAKWFEGTQVLTADEDHVYFRLCNHMYLLGGPLFEDHATLAVICKRKSREFSRLLDALIAKGKIHRESRENETFLWGNHVEDELETVEIAIETARKNGKQGGRKKKKQDVTEPSRLTEPLKLEEKRREESPLKAQDDGGLKEGEAEPESLPSEPTSEPDRTAEDGLPLPTPGSRAEGTNPRSLGTSLRQRGTNPRALGTNPRSRPAPTVPPAPVPVGTPETAAMFEALRSELGEAAFRAWMSPLQVAIVNGAIRIRAPTAFHASHVRGAWGDRMRTIVGADVEIEAGSGATA